MLTDKLKWTEDLCNRIKKDYNPYAVIVGFTSGGDSNIALKLATMFFKVDAAFTCNTTIAAQETLTNCEQVVTEHYKLKYISKMPPYGGIAENPETYFEIVKQHGFPGKTNSAHSWMYRWLKDHTVSRIVSSIRQKKRNRNIVIISGARKSESVRRMGTSEDITVKGSTIWVNICNQWNEKDCEEFAGENNLDNLRSPISKYMNMSGECFCGSYAKEGELMELKLFSPTTHEKIMFIEKYMNENTTMNWGWEGSPPKSRHMEKLGQTNMFSPQMLFCSTCMGNTLVEEANP